MCGICGLYNFNNTDINLDKLKLINKNLIKRGPDAGGFLKIIKLD